MRNNIDIDPIRAAFHANDLYGAASLLQHYNEEEVCLQRGIINTDDKMATLCQHLSNKVQSLVLDFSENISLEELGNNLKRNPNLKLKTLSLNGCNTRSRDLLTKLAFLPEGLEQIFLCHNQINTPETIALLEDLPNSVTMINLSHNNIQDNCTPSIIRLFQNKTNINYIELSGNNLSRKSVKRIANSRLSNENPYLSSDNSHLSNENLRLSQENIRLSNENLRLSQENMRLSNENQLLLNENPLRVSENKGSFNNESNTETWKWVNFEPFKITTPEHIDPKIKPKEKNDNWTTKIDKNNSKSEAKRPSPTACENLKYQSEQKKPRYETRSNFKAGLTKQ
jgi:hypothetical protein